MVHEAIEDGGGAGRITDQFAPVLERSIAGHKCRSQFVPAHCYRLELQVYERNACLGLLTIILFLGLRKLATL